MPPRTSAYMVSADDARINDLLLKLFRDPSLHYGDWLISTLPAAPKVTLANITLQQIDTFIDPISRERALYQYSLLTLLMFKVPKTNKDGVKVPADNPYHASPADSSKIRALINAARQAKGAPALPQVVGGNVNTEAFINYLEAQSVDAAADGFDEYALTDAELAQLINNISSALKQSGSSQTKQAIEFLTQGTPVATVGGIAKQFGDAWAAGEAEAYAAAKAKRDEDNPGRPLEASELSTLKDHNCNQYRALLEENLKLLDQHDKINAYRFNEIIRRAILQGDNLEAKLRVALGRLAIALRNAGCHDQANVLLRTVHNREFRAKILPKNIPDQTTAFMASIRARFIANYRLIFGAANRLPVQQHINDPANDLGQANVTGLVANIENNPGAIANEQQRRLARRLSKVLAAYEDYNIELTINNLAPGAAVDDGTAQVREYIVDRITHNFDKLRARVQRQAIVEIDGVPVNKTFYPVP